MVAGEPEPEPDISMAEIIRDVADARIPLQAQHESSPRTLAQMERDATVAVASEMVEHQAAEVARLEELPDAFVCPITHEGDALSSDGP